MQTTCIDWCGLWDTTQPVKQEGRRHLVGHWGTQREGLQEWGAEGAVTKWGDLDLVHNVLQFRFSPPPHTSVSYGSQTEVARLKYLSTYQNHADNICRALATHWIWIWMHASTFWPHGTNLCVHLETSPENLHSLFNIVTISWAILKIYTRSQGARHFVV